MASSGFDVAAASTGGNRKKLVVVGDGFCGKTSMLFRFTRDEFPDNYIPTVCEVTVSKAEVDGREVSMVLWDTAGQEDYDRLRPVCYTNTHVVLVCYAIDSANNFDNVQLKWVPEVRHHCPGVPIVLVGTKTDLRGSVSTGTCISREDGENLCRHMELLGYVECSAKTGEGIAAIFRQAARAAVNYTDARKVPAKKQCVVL